MVLEAEVAAQQGREQEAIRRERALLAKDAADVARAQAAEEEVVARIAEVVDDVRAEEKERQQAMEEELDELRRLVTALPTPKGSKGTAVLVLSLLALPGSLVQILTRRLHTLPSSACRRLGVRKLATTHANRGRGSGAAVPQLPLYLHY